VDARVFVIVTQTIPTLWTLQESWCGTYTGWISPRLFGCVMLFDDSAGLQRHAYHYTYFPLLVMSCHSRQSHAVPSFKHEVQKSWKAGKYSANYMSPRLASWTYLTSQNTELQKTTAKLQMIDIFGFSQKVRLSSDYPVFSSCGSVNQIWVHSCMVWTSLIFFARIKRCLLFSG
jgi:hypothetical protein